MRQGCGGGRHQALRHRDEGPESARRGPRHQDTRRRWRRNGLRRPRGGGETAQRGIPQVGAREDAVRRAQDGDDARRQDRDADGRVTVDHE